MTQLLERPTGSDFEWYLKDVVHSANKEGATLPGYVDSLSSPGLDNSLSSWIEGRLKHYLNVAQMKEDWGAVLRGEKKPTEVSSIQYCLDNLLVDSETVLSAPVRNTEALSAALRVELPLERERYLGKDVDRLKEIDIELRRLQSRGEFAPASLVVERLGVGERYLRTLASSGKLTRVKNKGLYAPASVFEYLKEEGRPIFY